MVLMWFIGDVGKTIYFVVRSSPAQFWICSCLQVNFYKIILDLSSYKMVEMIFLYFFATRKNIEQLFNIDGYR